MRTPVRLALLAACAASIPALSLGADSAMPERKPGWWELNLTIEGPTPQPVRQTVHMCTDAAVDAVQTPFGVHTGKSCPPLKVSRTPEGWTFAETCVLGQTTVSADGRAHGDFSSSYHVDLITRMTPPPVPQAAEVRMAIEAKWLGECPADKRPGDIETTTQTNVAPQGQ